MARSVNIRYIEENLTARLRNLYNAKALELQRPEAAKKLPLTSAQLKLVKRWQKAKDDDDDDKKGIVEAFIKGMDS